MPPVDILKIGKAVTMTNNLIISTLALIFAALPLFIASKQKNNRPINLIGYLIALILYGVFLDFGFEAVNDSAGDNVSILGLVLLIGGSVYLACDLSDKVRDKH